MRLGKAISTIRKQKKISQKELAGKCGLTVVALFKIERGITVPRHETVEALAVGLNVPMESLLLMALDRYDIHHEKDALFREVKRNL